MRPSRRRPGMGITVIVDSNRRSPSAAPTALSGAARPSHSPSTRTATPSEVVHSAMVARSPAIDSGPPPSTRAPNLGDRSPGKAWPSANASARTSGPAKGPTMTLRAASSSSRPSRSSASCSAGRWSSRRPRICRLARRVRSMPPLPSVAAISASPAAWSSVKAPHHGRTRTSRPSPLGIGRSAPGHQPLTSKGAARLMRSPAPRHGRAPRRSSCSA